jgi:hypothetical protein
MRTITAILFLTISLTFALLGSSQQNGAIKGTVVDYHSKEVLPGATVLVSGTTLGTNADSLGRFALQNVPVGLHNVEVRLLGYQTLTRTDVNVTPGRTTVITIELQESPLVAEGVTVSAGYYRRLETASAGSVAFNAEEIRRSPGSANDVSRILMALPSVSAVADNANDLAVRGGSPMENAFFVDGIPVPNINHFPVQGSSGGPIGILNVDFIENVDFLTSGFSAAHGDRTSSVVDIKFRNGNPDRTVGKAFLNFAGFGGMAEGPVSGGSWLVSASKSYLDLLVGAIGTGVAPQYGDIQGKLVTDIAPGHRLTLLNIFGASKIDFSRSTAIDQGQRYYGVNNNLQNTLGATWRAVWSPSFTSLTSVSFSGTRFEGDFFKVSTSAAALSSDNTEQTFVLRNISTLTLGKQANVEFGIDARQERGRFDYTIVGDTNRLGTLDPTYIIARSIESPKGSAFTTLMFNPLTNLRLSFGVRASYYDRNNRLHFEPRLGLTFNATENLTLKANAGMFHQDVPLIVLSSGSFNALDQIKAVHLGAGVEYLPTADIRVTLDLYDKEYRSLPLEASDPTLSVVDQAVFNQRFSTYTSLSSTGRAWTRGIEVMVQKKMARDLYGLVSASVFRSRYEDAHGMWHDRIYDNKYIFSIIGGYKPEGSWEFGIRWSYAGGAPYTPFDQAASGLARVGIIDQARILADRFPDYHSLNLRVDKKFYFERNVLDIYLSIWNAYNRKNVAQYFWNETKNRIDTQYQWSALPVVGVEYEF